MNNIKPIGWKRNITNATRDGHIETTATVKNMERQIWLTGGSMNYLNCIAAIQEDIKMHVVRGGLILRIDEYTQVTFHIILFCEKRLLYQMYLHRVLQSPVESLYPLHIITIGYT